MTHEKVMVGKTCNDWTSDSKDQKAEVGHSNGLGPGGDPPADTPSGTRHMKTEGAPTLPVRRWKDLLFRGEITADVGTSSR